MQTVVLPLLAVPAPHGVQTPSMPGLTEPAAHGTQAVWPVLLVSPGVLQVMLHDV
jgi:hypothetical protein